ncbi:hypothetical protein [Actinoallomurus sp. NPDC052274]|uniref:hypothetical protein n=1 Tax=Actinoallomurus sp. NPDC052274 TaxID=3155420 RepID=UPI00341F131A
MADTRTDVRVLLLYGDQAEITTPGHGADNPLRVPAATISVDSGIPVEELRGKRLTAVVDEAEGTARDFRRA